MSELRRVFWTRIRGNFSRDPILIGRKISPSWLKEEIDLTEFNLEGNLFNSFSALLITAKQEKKNLPIISLRTALIAGIDHIVHLDRDLGLLPDENGTYGCAIAMFPDLEDDDDHKKAKTAIAKYIRNWVINEVEPWAERNKMGELANKLKNEITVSNIKGTEKKTPLLGKNGKSPNFALIVRKIAERLIGEELFPGMKECELVVNPENRSSSIDLMTLPRRTIRGDDMYSMVARLTICTMPYSKELYLGVTATKRVWSRRVPIANSKMPKRVTSYVMSAGRPAISVSVERTEAGWAFSDAYAVIQQESNFRLPESLEQAIANRDFDPSVNWWVGLPELPTLFKYISPRTVFEGDEATLLENVASRLGTILETRKITLREIPLGRKKKPLQEMLRLTDLDFGAAGDSLVSEPLGEDSFDIDDVLTIDRNKNIQHYREQNIRALRLCHGDIKPLVWVLCDSLREKQIIENSIKTLFGDAVDINLELLPSGTHGLRIDLDSADQKAVVRFSERVKRWSLTTSSIQNISADRPIIALICAADKYNQRNEDPVNYFAGIHALSKIGANVHHLLPIEISHDSTAEQAFLHRTQSALLDVLLAHSGIIFGTKDFTAQLLPSTNIPRCIYGLQAIRSKARNRSGETGVTFILNTRLIIETGTTEVQYVYKTTKGTSRTKWMPLSKGLQWLGSQRQMHEGDERWLRQIFEDETKQTLFEISQDDPKAIVMLDWQSLAGLWRGIRDSDLALGDQLRLGNTDLSVFQDMTFIRLRRGADTISLRTEVKIVFEGWIDGADGSRIKTGESQIDSYYTTEKELVEISDEIATYERQYGHFIATMGYAKTVQVKRGFSCYRPMPRMHIIKGTKEYEQKMLDPAEMDASLPSSMEITVLKTPNGVVPSNIAMLIMGLRIGYAHYNDWTTLPAPLFFRRKIEDYVIRFPEEDDFTNNSEISTDTTVILTGAIAPELSIGDEETFISRLINNETKAADQSSFQEEILPTITKAEENPDQSNDLLTRAKNAIMPVLHTTNDIKLLTLGRRMLHEQTNVRVRVDLPYWFKSQGAFGSYSPTISRNAGRCWRRMHQFGIVSRISKKPKDSDFLNWMTRLLQVPHACHALSPACLEIGGLHFVRFSELINESYNAEKPLEEKASTYILNSNLMRSMAVWANANRHDELLAWLVFQVAQYPQVGFCQAVLESITEIPGPMTEESINYYLDVIWALDNAIAQKNHLSKFQAVLRRRPKPINFDSTIEASENQEPQIISPHHTQTIQDHFTAAIKATEPDEIACLQLETPDSILEDTINSQLNTTMNSETLPNQTDIELIRSKLNLLIQNISPGAPDFLEQVNNFYVSIEELKLLHSKKMELQDLATQLHLRLTSLKDSCTELIIKLDTLKEHLSLGLVAYVEPSPDQLDIAEESIVGIQSIIEDIEVLYKQIDQFENTSGQLPFDERRKRAKIVSDAWEAITDSRNNLIDLLNQSPCLNIQAEPENRFYDDLSINTSQPDHKTQIPKSPEEEKNSSEQLSTVDLAPIPIGDLEKVSTDSQDKESSKILLNLPQEISSKPEPMVYSSVRPEPIDAEDNPLKNQETVEDYGLAEEEPIDENDPESIQQQAKVLHRLISKHMFGIALVHVEAMKPMLADFSNSDINTHYIILNALVNSLDRLECKFEFSPKLDSNLKELLANQTLSNDVLCDSASMALGVLAAGLSSMLFDREDDQWNIGNSIGQRLVGYESITQLIEHIDTLRQHGLPLTRDMFANSHIGDQEALRLAMKQHQQRAAKWKNDPDIYSNFHHRGFKSLHELIFNPKKEIGACIELIAKGENKKLYAVYEEARRKLEKASNTVDDYFRQMGEKSRPEGMYRSRAIDNIEITRRFIEEYLEMIRRKENPNVELVRSIQGFLATLHQKLEAAIIEITQIPVDLPIAHCYRDAALSTLHCALRLFTNKQSSTCISLDDQKLLIQVPLNRDLMPVLGHVDSYTPEICSHLTVLEETDRWSNDDLLLLEKEDNGIDSALRDAMRLHINAQRFLPAFLIEQRLPRNMLSETEPLIQLYNKRKATFAGELQSARQRVTHAMTLSALTQSEAHRMQRVIEEMQESIRPDRGIGHPLAEKNAYPDFPQATAALRHNVLIPLETQLNKTANLLREELDRYANESRGISSPQDIQRVREMLSSENAATLRTAYDAMTLLKNTHKLPAKLDGFTNIASSYDQLMSNVFKSVQCDKPYIEALLEALLSEPADEDPDWLAALDYDQRQEGVKIIESWLKLFQTQRRNNIEIIEPLSILFSNLGISHEPTIMPDSNRSNRLWFMLPERSFTFSTNGDELFIPPILGSRATNIQGYMLFGTVQETELRQVMHEVGGTPTLVLARTRLSMQKRARISSGAPAIIIDDELICYISIHPNERLQALLRIGILTFGTNPYDDYGGRPVPTEMFFGRQKELDRLRDVKSLGILYGGRRLGKSSLLSQVEIENSNIPGRKAVYISMDTVDSSTNHVFSAWDFIYRNLISRGIINSLPNTVKKWEEIRDWISKEISANQTLNSLYLLIDEADALMGCELYLSKGEIGFVRSLQQMVENLQHSCHIRYVIAGLHNMTRMTTEENSVLGKAEPIALEPFSTPEDMQRGIRLITKPLAAMGYLFGESSEDLPLRILSVCNFYPAFIQLYCKSLVDRLQNRRQERIPPLYINSDDLDAVENDSNLLNELRRKFELNLDLDKRYKAIALILADTYYSEIESGHYNGLSISEITDLCETFASHHFSNTGPGVYEALLDEMIKLNVIDRVGTRYVLRNPNIAMMMGDNERVTHKIEELAREPSVNSRSLGERRIQMEHGSNQITFPFPVAWVRRYIDPSDGELLIITGNELSGIMDLTQPHPRDEWNIGLGQDFYTVLHGSGPSAANDYVNQLRKGSKKNKAANRIVAVRQNQWAISQIPEFASVAAKASKAGIRFILLALPERALELASMLDESEHNQQVAQNWRIVPIPQWTADAIYFRMRENSDISENSDVINHIINTTCGFQKEVLDICKTKITVEKVLKSSSKSKDGLSKSLSEFYHRIGIPDIFTPERRIECNSFIEAINGAQRLSPEVEEIRELQGVSKAEMNFIHWMGILQEGAAGTWRVPSLYIELLNKQDQ